MWASSTTSRHTFVFGITGFGELFDAIACVRVIEVNETPINQMVNILFVCMAQICN
jgi:hypothetical protein